MKNSRSKVKSANGKYYEIFNPSHPDANKKGYVYEHRLVAEKIVGRCLKKRECVHHIDNNGLNNEPNNLMVFATEKDHAAFHKGAEIGCCNNIYYAKSHFCGYCGTKLISKRDKNRELCAKCFHFISSDFGNKPDKKELYLMLKQNQYNYTKTGRIYGVTGAAIKKWAKQYDLYTNCFPQIYNESEFKEYMLDHIVSEASRHFSVSNKTIITWCKKLGLQYKKRQVKCIEANTIYNSAKDAVKHIFPDAVSYKSQAQKLTKAIKTGNLYLNYHWEEVLV